MGTLGSARGRHKRRTSRVNAGVAHDKRNQRTSEGTTKQLQFCNRPRTGESEIERGDKGSARTGGWVEGGVLGECMDGSE